jgi:OPT oligopeptide transporter protein
MFPLLTGFSVFCLANPRSPDFTRVFGGSNGNEGLGLLSVCFDWQYISASTNPFAIPLRAQVHESVLELCRIRAHMCFPVLQLDRIFIVHVSLQPCFITIITAN